MADSFDLSVSVPETVASLDIPVVTTYAQQSWKLRQVTEMNVLGLWDATIGLAPTISPEVSDLWGDAVGPLIEAAQQEAVSMTQAYLEDVISDAIQRRIVATFDKKTLLRDLRGGTPNSEVYYRPVKTARTVMSVGGTREQANVEAKKRLSNLAKTDLQLARVKTSHAVLNDPDVAPSVKWYKRVLTGARNCGLCALASTRTYYKADLQPIHPGCVIGSTVVSGPGAIRGTRRWYEGEAIVVGTASGDFLTITPNHPVLTSHGWIPAGLLKHGDEVVTGSDRHGVIGGIPNEQQMPSLIEDQFGSLAMRSLVSVPVSAEDFHGDGFDPEIDVELVDRLLGGGVESSALEPFGYSLFRGGLEIPDPFFGLCPLHSLGVSGLPALGGTVGGSGLGSSFGFGHSAVPGLARLGSAPNLVASLAYRLVDRLSVDAVLDRQSQHALATEIAGDDLGRDHRSGPRFDPPLTEFTTQGRGAYASQGRRLLHRLAGQVQLDRIVHLRRIRLADHVYNLQTTEGWYSANRVIVSNCDCIVMPMTTEPRKIVADPEFLAKLKELGVTENDVVVYKHGEYGPTLARSEHRHLTSASAKDRPTMDAETLEGRETRPVLGGYLADSFDERGRPNRADWAKVVGETETFVEVASGPSIVGRDNPPGPGLAYVTADGRLFYVEYDVIYHEPQQAAERMIRTLMKEEAKSLPKGVDGTYWTPPDAVLSIQSLNRWRDEDGNLFQVSADAGRGRVVHYNGTIRKETVWHENGHVVAGAVNRQGFNEGKLDPRYWSSTKSNGPGAAWAEAMEADAKHLAEAAFGDEGSTFDGTTEDHDVSRWGAFDFDGEYVVGVTGYGTKSDTEDFAESWRLAVRSATYGEVARYIPEGAGKDDWEPITFEEMYPNRYAYLKELESQLGVAFPF